MPIGFTFTDCKPLAGLYLRHLGGRVYAVTHGNAGFIGESWIRFLEGQVVECPDAGEWTIYVERLTKPGLAGWMIAKAGRVGTMPQDAAKIADVTVE